jgi:hypothetical protein
LSLPVGDEVETGGPGNLAAPVARGVMDRYPGQAIATGAYTNRTMAPTAAAVVGVERADGEDMAAEGRAERPSAF